ncbi:unnamed protein product [Macrosiphum euphorbiae]|uniref:Uncharacterized protein n=1 Tax=Macrosiphum euphorbiae TaxID=13131 RepID=A0AAV0X4G5_9HEMI|nr:unnamed protein product [Macrosiphum euphorbiae]
MYNARRPQTAIELPPPPNERTPVAFHRNYQFTRHPSSIASATSSMIYTTFRVSVGHRTIVSGAYAAISSTSNNRSFQGV